jgi:hypothetical protein
MVTEETERLLTPLLKPVSVLIQTCNVEGMQLATLAACYRLMCNLLTPDTVQNVSINHHWLPNPCCMSREGTDVRNLLKVVVGSKHFNVKLAPEVACEIGQAECSGVVTCTCVMWNWFKWYQTHYASIRNGARVTEKWFQKLNKKVHFNSWETSLAPPN